MLRGSFIVITGSVGFMFNVIMILKIFYFILYVYYNRQHAYTKSYITKTVLINYNKNISNYLYVLKKVHNSAGVNSTQERSHNAQQPQSQVV